MSEPLLLTIDQAAHLAQVSRPTIVKWTHRSDFPVIRDGRLVRIPVDLFKSWLELQAAATNHPPAALAEVRPIPLVQPSRRRAR